MRLNTLILENLKNPEGAVRFLAEQDLQIRLLSEALCGMV
jgi:hypothetical protein